MKNRKFEFISHIKLVIDVANYHIYYTHWLNSVHIISESSLPFVHSMIYFYFIRVNMSKENSLYLFFFFYLNIRKFVSVRHLYIPFIILSTRIILLTWVHMYQMVMEKKLIICINVYVHKLVISDHQLRLNDMYSLSLVHLYVEYIYIIIKIPFFFNSPRAT